MTDADQLDCRSMTDAAAPTGATRPERIDFLKQVVSFTESNVRSYDTKAQISLAAFVLSANPVVAIAGVGCSPPAGKMVLMVLIAMYFTTIMTYLWVLWPVAPPVQKLTDGLRTQNAFFVHDPVALGAVGFTAKLAQLDVEGELTSEALKLAHIRRVKARRFKTALMVTAAAYAVIAFAYFIVGRCI
jgi:hypothetical protein